MYGLENVQQTSLHIAWNALKDKYKFQEIFDFPIDVALVGLILN